MANTNSWGGTWTEKKLTAFEKYVNAYLTIMNKHRYKYDWKLIYFDGFAGSGTRKDDKQSELYNELFPADVDDYTYKGAAERVLNIVQQGFDFYHFIDRDENASEKLSKKLDKYKASKNLLFKTGDANDQLAGLADEMTRNRKYKALVLLDPFGMQIEWNSIQKLTNLSCDLWVLIPTGVIVNRLLDRQGNLSHLDKLQSFFGMSEDDIRNVFYETKSEMTLFGESETITKKTEAITRIAEIYISKLKTIFEYVTEKPLVLYNTRKIPIFHFAFASKNQTAKKIAGEIIRGID